jgi:N-acetylglucosaminyldiphosphoundecaprenol N-acetyl-beta-D-mannosaminyltransferase
MLRIGQLAISKQIVLDHSSRGGVDSYSVLGVPIANTNLQKAIQQVVHWSNTASFPRLVTFTNVHMLTEGHLNLYFLKHLLMMDMNCPDGMPLVWLGKLKARPIGRVSGPDFMLAFCTATVGSGYRHFFYGGAPGVAEDVIEQLKAVNPTIQIAGFHAPPYRNLDPAEEEHIVQQINASGADIVWVCLGCPKQEVWMSEHRDRLNVRVVLAVGMAFDIIAGRMTRAPSLMRKSGLEWFYRLTQEPNRLARRYIATNTTFLFLLLRDALQGEATMGFELPLVKE